MRSSCNARCRGGTTKVVPACSDRAGLADGNNTLDGSTAARAHVSHEFSDALGVVRTRSMRVNRLTDLALQEASNAVLREACIQRCVVLTPHSQAHALYADRRNSPCSRTGSGCRTRVCRLQIATFLWMGSRTRSAPISPVAGIFGPSGVDSSSNQRQGSAVAPPIAGTSSPGACGTRSGRATTLRKRLSHRGTATSPMTGRRSRSGSTCATTSMTARCSGWLHGFIRGRPPISVHPVVASHRCMCFRRRRSPAARQWMRLQPRTMEWRRPGHEPLRRWPMAVRVRSTRIVERCQEVRCAQVRH